MRIILASMLMVFALSGCALWAPVLLAPAVSDTATVQNSTNGGVFEKYVWDPACDAVGGTIVPAHGTYGAHNCVTD